METIKWLVHMLDRHSGSGTIILTFVLVAITAYYAIQANAQVKETRRATESYSTLEARRLEEIVRVSASIIYIDIMTAMSEIISICKIDKGLNYSSPRNITFNRDFSVYCANLGCNLSFEEMTLVNALYGMIEKINIEISKIDYYNSILTNIQDSANLLGIEIFGDEQNYFGTAKKYDYKVFNQELVINDMKQVYTELLNKLKKLAIDDSTAFVRMV